MRIGLFVLLGLCFVFAEPDDAPGIASHVEKFRNSASLNFLEKSHMVLYLGEKRLSGFGDFANRKGWSYDFIGGRIEYGDKVNLDSCKYQGYDCYGIVLDGEKYYPENTDSISINGIPGIPKDGVWRFRIETGKAVAFARTPLGSPDSVEMAGRGHALAAKKDREKFKANLRAVPEAFELWDSDPLGALRYFNQAQPYEIVSDTAYEALGDADFPATSSMHTGNSNFFRAKLEKRIAQNAKDLLALGRLAELYCHQGQFQKAEDYLGKIRAIYPSYFRLHLVRGYCEENKENRNNAILHYELGRQTAPPFLIPQIAERINLQVQQGKTDSLFKLREDKPFFMEASLGFGMPYSILGVGISAGVRIKGFAVAFSLAEGVAQLQESAIPTVGIRLALPGRKWIPYLGFWDYAIFDAKIRDELRYIGGGIGLLWDIGQPFGFRLDLSVGRMHSPSYVSDDDKPGERTVVEDIWLPNIGFSYEF